jgi:hypothetical protein
MVIESISDDHIRLILEKLERHVGEEGSPENGLQAFERILKDHEELNSAEGDIHAQSSHN